jgi:hypothetical protein
VSAFFLLLISVVTTVFAVRHVRRTPSWRRPRTPHESYMWAYVVVTPLLWLLFAVAAIKQIR